MSEISGVIIDNETGGLDTERCAITEIAALEFASDGGRLVERAVWHTRVIPNADLFITPKAASIQGKTFEQIIYPENGITENNAYDGLLRFLQWDCHFANWKLWAHNAPFDHGFLHNLEKRRKLPTPPWFPSRCDWGCTKSLATMLVLTGKMPGLRSTSLQALAQYFNIGTGERTSVTAHSALGDARLTLLVLERLLKVAGWLEEAR